MTNLGYLNPPAIEAYYFIARDAFRTRRHDADGSSPQLLSPGLGRRAEIFARGRSLNAFNQEGIDTASALNQSVLTPNNNVQLRRFNPFIDAAVRATDWNFGKDFGKPLSRFAYQLPRTYGFLVGFHF